MFVSPADYAGVNFALLADLSGIPSAFRNSSHGSSPHVQHQFALGILQLQRAMTHVVDSPVPRAVVFGKRLLCPARFARTLQYQSKVSFLVIRSPHTTGRLRRDHPPSCCHITPRHPAHGDCTYVRCLHFSPARVRCVPSLKRGQGKLHIVLADPGHLRRDGLPGGRTASYHGDLPVRRHIAREA